MTRGILCALSIEFIEFVLGCVEGVVLSTGDWNSGMGKGISRPGKSRSSGSASSLS